MQKALVTGGAGFIGSHLVDKLKDSYKVHVLDNLSTGDTSFIPKNVPLYIEDVRNKDKILSIVQKVKPDIIFHIAGQASNINSFSDPHFDIDVNFKGTVNVVLAALAANVTRFLYASSMTAYGHPDSLPVSEKHSCKPVSYYGISKYAAERFVHATAARTDLTKPFNVTSFRMFNVYGPRQSLTNSYQGALAIFIGNVLRNEPITIYGDGLQTRDFIYIDDVIQAWTRAIDTKSTFQQVYNLGNGKQISVKDMVKAVILAAGKNPDTYPVIYKDQRPGEQRFMEADMKKAFTDFSFKPSTSFAKGLTQTHSWAQSQLESSAII